MEVEQRWLMVTDGWNGESGRTVLEHATESPDVGFDIDDVEHVLIRINPTISVRIRIKLFITLLTVMFIANTTINIKLTRPVHNNWADVCHDPMAAPALTAPFI